MVNIIHCKTVALRGSKNGKEFPRIFKILSRNCLRCNLSFETPYTRKLYCSRNCYMLGVKERSDEWKVTESKKSVRKS
jgi:hypothetical protein